MGQVVFGTEAYGVNFTIATEAGDARLVTVSLINAGHVRTAVDCYLASDATGDTLSAAPTTLAIGTKGTIILEYTANLFFKVISEPDNSFDISIGQAGAATYYLVVILPTGRLAISPAIVLA